MSVNQNILESLRQQLGLTQAELPDEDISVALNTLVAGATRNFDSDGPPLIQSTHQAILAHGLVSKLDIFTIIPLLLESSRDASDDFIAVIAEECSAKEMVIVLQEVSERLKSTLSSLESEDDEEDEGVDVSQTRARALQQVIRIISTYAKVVPRLSKGRKTPNQILYPPFTQLQQLLLAFRLNINERDVDAILRALNSLTVSAAGWAGEDQDVKDLLYALAVSTVQAFSSKLGTNVAINAFEEQFPRLRQLNRVSTSQSLNTDPVTDLNHTLHSIGLNPTQLPTSTPPSLSSLVFIAHTPTSPTTPSPTLETLRTLFPLILASLQTNTALPSTLAFLLRTLGPLTPQVPPSFSPSEPVPIELLTILSTLLPQIASFHPDPTLRHITFRLLSIVLKLTPPSIRIHVLRDLVTHAGQGSDGGGAESGGESMTVAGVGLVKDSVLAALGRSGEGEDVFATPMFSEIFVPVLFVPRLPPTAPSTPAKNEDELEAFLASSEPSRLVEVFGLYWLLVKRDMENKTGIRTPNVTMKIQTTLLMVVREKLRRWDSIDLKDAEEAKMQLGILDMWLDRIDEALR
ncbi:hypothetical protein BDY19DRAFT_994160 [Irpex rosettiformis]|uniref:Uncharacterized protein n=1 Tax=Irpex rosettiformis TaxID=378272 RepID=A0ACB8U1Z8_9APHY|nr:hypothetical protein BDY19DRAFT_994160 [Irpex rosettiformis]